MISIIKGFWTIVFIFIVISTTFRPICPPDMSCGYGRGTYPPKRFGNDNKYEDNSPKTLNDKNFSTSLTK